MPRFMAPPPSSEYNVVLEQPFGDELPKKRIEIFGEPNRDGQIKVTDRSGPNLDTIIVHEGTIDTDDSREVFALLSTLRGLPSNPDKDIYGLDTRLAFTHDMQWDNGGDESVGSVEAENKDDFKRVVDSLLALARQKAKQESRQ